MPEQCCSQARKQSQSRASKLARFAKQSVLCGILGSMKFLIALAAYVQAYAFLMLCKGSMDPAPAEVLRANKEAAKTNLKLGMLPAIEMFLLAPAMFVGLHVFLNVGMIYCLAACWALMFTVCFTVRIAGILTSCPAIKSPLYGEGYPFPVMEHKNKSALDPGLVAYDKDAESRVSVSKACAIALAFVPFRLLTAVAQAGLLVTEAMSLLVVSISDVCIAIYRGFSSKMLSSSSQQRGSTNFQASRESLKSISSLTKTFMTDLLWVMTFGMSGAISLRDATRIVSVNPLCATASTESPYRSSSPVAGGDSASHSENTEKKSCCQGKTASSPQTITPGETTQTEQPAEAPATLQSATSTSCCSLRQDVAMKTKLHDTPKATSNIPSEVNQLCDTMDVRSCPLCATMSGNR